MVTTKIVWIIITVFLMAVSLLVVADGNLAWGAFLGASWRRGEGEREGGTRVPARSMTPTCILYL
jgi:hypothetical protein